MKEKSLKTKEREFLIHLKQKCDIFGLKAERGFGTSFHRSLWEVDYPGNGRYDKIIRKLELKGYVTQRNGSRDNVKYIALTRKGLEHIN